MGASPLRVTGAAVAGADRVGVAEDQPGGDPGARPQRADEGFGRRVARGDPRALSNLNTETIGDIQIPLPPFHEQRAIAEVEMAIARLEEYRTALIAAAVTGKIRVDGQLQVTVGTFCLLPLPQKRGIIK